MKEQFIEETAGYENGHEAAAEYLQDKLDLYSNLRNHFDSIGGLQEMLISHMDQRAGGADSEVLDRETKMKLADAGVFYDEKITAFLLLIAERVRTFDDVPIDASDEDLCRYYFGKYKAQEEKWPTNEFDFRKAHSDSFQTKRERILEEVAIDIITQSRASRARAIEPMPREVVEFLAGVDAYFKRAFADYFGIMPPVSIARKTRITTELTSHADRVSGLTFIDQNDFKTDPLEFGYTAIHEAMHLSFDGFAGKMIEEALIEYFIGKMIEETPHNGIIGGPASRVYQEWKKSLEVVFGEVDGLEQAFKEYFLHGDIAVARELIKNGLTEEKADWIVSEKYSTGIEGIIRELKKI